MKTVSFSENVSIYENRSELSEAQISLIGEAGEAIQSAHAPYSNFKVGAALALQNGTIIRGSNQENASFPEGLCA